ncbi:hypothetical protein R3W88_023215 [Solanum pinnatisectum]|uniref:Disease resistance protein At4g27190-like leucine-rich repeats domain-containing protein n=1 Tax=Solanum pinnatisectum TaxID=50273 RepID=A0AAV9M0P2_9SOLN|nr:hypothetical protein R3W88_023215 [Solanum pinnatisectum]
MCMTIWIDSTPSSKSINVLSGDDPWTMFTQKAEENLKVPPGFEEIGKKIVEECRGLPIALPTIESALYKKDLTYWETAATRFDQQQPKSVAKAGEKLNNWPGKMLACSCGAISLMSNHLEKLPDGVIHCLETETVLLQDNNKLKLSLPSSAQYLSLLRLLSLDNCIFITDVSMIGTLNKLEIMSLLILVITSSLQCENVPPGVISSMDKLEELYMQGCFADWVITNEKKEIQLPRAVDLKLNIYHIQKTEGISAEELPPGSLQEVKMVEVSEYPNMKDSLLPPNLIQIKSNLEEVKVTGTSVKAVFGFDGITVQGGQLRKLNRLTLQNLSQLTSLWKGPSELVMFHRLEVVKVSQCENLRYIFPYAVSDYLYEVPESITLPRLTTLRLQRLPHLTDFYTQEAYLRCPELQRLHKQDCKRLRTNLSDYHSDHEIQEKSS